MAKKKKKTRVSTAAPSDSASTSLGGLLAGLGFSATETPAAAPEVEAATTGDLDLSRQGRLVLRMERKGRGGKTVTVLAGLVGSPDQVDAVARTLKKALGTGARVEDGEVVVQGDVRERLRTWLTARGVRRISG